jgi:putative transposase
MPHSFNKIWIHAIWSTKDRYPLIGAKIEAKVYDHLRKQFIESGCPVRIISGMPDHIHALFLLNPQKTIAEIIKQVKGSTAHYINENNFMEQKFAWQVGYAGFSVSESAVEKVFEYIDNQKNHHTKKTFQQEYDDFLRLYGFGNG